MNKKNSKKHIVAIRTIICLMLMLMTTTSMYADRRHRHNNDSTAKENDKEAIATFSDSLLVAAKHIDSIINYGRRFIGTPYRYGGTTPGGFDCSGFTMFIFGKYGHILPHKGTLQYQATVPIRTENAVRGDLIYFEGRSHNKSIGHVGVITEKLPDGSFNFLHSSTSRGVIISSTKEDYYARRFLKVSRVVAPFKRSPHEMPWVGDSLHTPQPGDSIIIVYEKQTVTEPAVYHIVKSGETLSSIARKYHTTVANIQKLNKMSGDFLAEKQRLKIKNSYTKTIEVPVKKLISEVEDDEEDIEIPMAETKPAEQKPAEAQAAANGEIRHKVMAGETLSSLARTYKTSVADIQRLNGLTSSNIHAGDVLIVKAATVTEKPTKEPEKETIVTEKQIEEPVVETKVAEPAPAKPAKPTPTVYRVKQGDTLWKIAKAHNVTVEAIIEANHLSDDHLSIDQKLTIPTKK